MFQVSSFFRVTWLDLNDGVGTSRYFDDAERPRIPSNESARLKCDNSGPVPIILVPQPSEDPNDPLVGRNHLNNAFLLTILH